jgi:tetratricopeptide (TPR) repeat protein
MLYRTVPSPKGALSPHEILRLAEIYLENASKEENPNVSLVLCYNAEVALSQAKSSSRKSSNSAFDPDEQAIRDKMAAAYYRLGKLLENNGHRDEAAAFYKKCKKWG